MRFGERVRQLRQAKGYTLRDLAAKVQAYRKAVERALQHDSSTNSLIRRYRAHREATS